MKKIIFDFDGTLVNSNEAVIASLNATFFEFKGEMPDYTDDIEPILGKPLEIQIGHFDLENLEEGIAYYRNYYKGIRDEKTLAYEGVEPLLRILKQRGYEMGILSNKGPDGLAHGLDKFGYNEYFQIVVSKDDVTEKKPHPDCFKPVLEAMGDQISDYIIVGDSTSDIELGHNLGITSVLVKWSLLPIEAFSHAEPDYIMDTPLDLLNILKILEEKDA
jgi:HAD superfamily hydrolase (TIGR01509 family)